MMRRPISDMLARLGAFELRIVQCVMTVNVLYGSGSAEVGASPDGGITIMLNVPADYRADAEAIIRDACLTWTFTDSHEPDPSGIMSIDDTITPTLRTNPLHNQGRIK